MKYLFLLSVIIIGGYPSLQACSCVGGPFMEVVQDDSVIVLAQVTRHLDHGFTIQVKSTLLGQLTEKKLTVWGDPGHLCRAGSTYFEDGETYVMALTQIKVIYEGLNFSPEKVGDWEISGCGSHFLEVEDTDVMGRITDGDEQMSLDELRELLGVPVIHAEVGINPAMEEIQLWLPWQPAHPWQVSLYDSYGRLVSLPDPFSPEDRTVRVSYHALTPGIYILRLSYEGVYWTKKLWVPGRS